ncbi:MAG: hypothetical protein Q7T76_20845 [Ferruginibacter sp.]|nr:hypothetical protein [Ferruginibacter sp.]
MIQLILVTGAMLGLASLILLAGRWRLAVQFSKKVQQLFSESANISDKTFNHDSLAELPPPVQRYFKHVLKEGEPYMSYARITHTGEFKTGFDKGWAKIEGEQYATTKKPGFIWKGKTSIFVARDMYIGDTGRLVVSLFSLFKVVDAKGDAYNQGELLRWLGESVLYPTNLLPSERLRWFPMDAHKAKLTFNYLQLSLFFIISFNDVGEIIQMETQRYMDDKNLETWIIKLAAYKQINGVVVPTAFEVLWRLKKGDFSYAKFNLQQIEYNKPHKFEEHEMHYS